VRPEWILAALLVFGCSKNPVKGDDGTPFVCDHVDADGFVVERADSVVAMQWQGTVSGGFLLEAGANLGAMRATFLDQDSARVSVGAGCSDLGLRWEIADTTVAQAGTSNGETWSFHLWGKARGSTTLRLRIWHVDHADFTSLELPISVAPSPCALDSLPQGILIEDGPHTVATWNFNPDRGPNISTGPIPVAPGGTRSGLSIRLLGAWNPGGGGTEAGSRAPYPYPSDPITLGWTVANPGVASLAPVPGEPWKFDIAGGMEGTTTVTFRLSCRAGVVWTSGPIAILVDDGSAADLTPDFYFKKNGVRTVIVDDGVLVSTICGATANPGRLETGVGQLTDLYFTEWWTDACVRVDPASTDFLVFEFADDGIARIVQHPIHWGERSEFHLEGVSAGETTVRAYYFKGGALNWISPPLPVRVNAP
jgi:hypothetical protein